MTNNNGGPWWVKTVINAGVMGFLLAYMLGAVPGMKSPIDRLTDAIAAHDKGAAMALAELVQLHKDILRVTEERRR